MTGSSDISYSLDCFSLTPSFEPPVIYRIFEEYELDIGCGKRFELSNGLERGELGKFYDLGVCNLLIQKNMLMVLTYHQFSFAPSMDDLEKILSLYEHNKKWPAEPKRLRFDHEMKTAPHFDYTPLSHKVHAPIYTRHPLTGVVSKHEYPHPDLPNIRLHIHPVFAAYHASPCATIWTDPVPSCAGILHRIFQATFEVNLEEFVTMYPQRARVTNPNHPLSYLSPRTGFSPNVSLPHITKRKRGSDVTETDTAFVTIAKRLRHIHLFVTEDPFDDDM